MTHPRLALLLGGALLASALALPATADDTPAVVNACVASVPETDLLAPGRVEICYTLFRPASASPDNPAPVVLHSHGWGGSRTKSASSFSKWLDAGIGVLSFDQRGFGESGGKAHVEDPAFEGADTIKMIDVVAAQSWVKKSPSDANDPVIGAIGGSYGGGFQFVGAFTEMSRSGKTRFDALAPEITWWSLSESLAPQGVVRTAWTALLYAAGVDAHTSTVHAGLAQGVATGQWPDQMADFFEDNGPEFHVANGRQLDIPVVFGQGITDNLFPLDQGLQNFDGALSDAAKAKSIFVGYNGGHVLPSTLPSGNTVTNGDPCSQALAGGKFEQLALRFMKENLLGTPATLTGHGQYHLATDANTCHTVDSVTPTVAMDAGTVVSTTAAGAPVGYELAPGPLRIAGSPTVTGTITALGADTRAFFALAVGTTPLDAKVVQHNTLPFRTLLPMLGEAGKIKLPSVAVDVPAGKKLFLVVSPVADMFGGHGSRTPGALLIENAKVNLPVQP